MQVGCIVWFYGISEEGFTGAYNLDAAKPHNLLVALESKATFSGIRIPFQLLVPITERR